MDYAPRQKVHWSKRLNGFTACTYEKLFNVSLFLRATTTLGLELGRTHGPDGETALHDKLFGWPAPGWPSGPCIRVGHPASAHRALVRVRHRVWSAL